MPQFPVTLVGNLTADPTLKMLPSGNHVSEIRVAASRSIRDESQPSGWRDVDHLFISGEMWGQLAVNARASLVKGMTVIVTGRIVTQEWEGPAEFGEERPARRQKIIMKIDRLGLDLSRYLVSSKRTDVAEHLVQGLDAPESVDVDALVDEIVVPREPAEEPGAAPLVGASAGSSETGDETTAPF